MARPSLVPRLSSPRKPGYPPPNKSGRRKPGYEAAMLSCIPKNTSQVGVQTVQTCSKFFLVLWAFLSAFVILLLLTCLAAFSDFTPQLFTTPCIKAINSWGVGSGNEATLAICRLYPCECGRLVIIVLYQKSR